MPKLFLPKWVKYHIKILAEPDREEVCKDLAARLDAFKCTNPEVSVVIPAWNEEENILATLSSLASQKTERKIEFIVINNNSTDGTQKLIDACRVKSFFVSVRSISQARQRGLEEARGKYILCADSDSIYPPKWIDSMVKELQNDEIICVYGKHSFIPENQLKRLSLAVYESLANLIFIARKKRKEYLNVLGFNFGFRKEDGINVGGFNTNREKWSDGWMGMKLAEKGKLLRLDDDSAVVWTNPRRLIIDGGLVKAFSKRLNKELKVIKEYLVPVG